MKSIDYFFGWAKEELKMKDFVLFLNSSANNNNELVRLKSSIFSREPKGVGYVLKKGYFKLCVLGAFP